MSESQRIALEYTNALIERGNAEFELYWARQRSAIGAALVTEHKRLIDAQARVNETRDAVRRAQ